MSQFVITNRSNGEYRYSLKADNGEIILSGEGYLSKQGVVNGVGSVRTHAPVDANYERKKSANGKHYFNLKASNGEVIGTSEMYESEAGRESGIESVKENAPGASIDEQEA
jgi:uncharacterized protein YegP (UPF0339 family)